MNNIPFFLFFKRTWYNIYEIVELRITIIILTKRHCNSNYYNGYYHNGITTIKTRNQERNSFMEYNSVLPQNSGKIKCSFALISLFSICLLSLI